MTSVNQPHNRQAGTAFLMALALSLCGCSLSVERPLSFFSSISNTTDASIEDSNSGESVHARMIPPPIVLSQLPAPKLVENAEVKHQIRYLLRHNGRGLMDSMARRQEHLAMVRKVFSDEGVPHELINLAVVESGFNLNAKSYAGAVGLWQLMKSTAKLYGLRINKVQDDRIDPVLSSVAAARHLRDLFSIYKDWDLALAAYNAGPGAVNRAMQKSGLTDFWSLSRKGKLCSQTRNFVPRFIAVNLIFSQPEKYGLSLSEISSINSKLALEKQKSTTNVAAITTTPRRAGT